MLRAVDIALMIDHSLLRPELTQQDVVEGCRLARELETKSVCVAPCNVKLAAGELAGSPVLTTTVIGFPHGYQATEVKAAEARRALEDGAAELDMVINIGWLRSGAYDRVEADIRGVVELAHARRVIVKVILENCYLTDAQKVEGCRIAERAGADFVKTSTGFGSGGSTLEDLRLMRRTVGPSVQVKAAGGVRTLDAALAVRATGATRFGATATRAILEEARRREAAGTLKLPD
ncbi:MAG TPA: deoxyribose-phosphate aldolase [Spirochaetia bacterium]|nr:deoxyribose-phosphate aldolase [Spirochaetia bacterium]